MLDAKGRVVGIVDQIATSGADLRSGVGFAVPVDLLVDELDALAAGRAVRHAYLGVGSAATTSTTAGALIERVAAGGPAALSGLQVGDIVTAAASTAIRSPGALISAIAALQPGDDIALTVRRGSETRKLTVTLGTQPTD